MKLFTKNAITAAVGLSLAGIAGAYDMQNNDAKSIIWKYHNCEMNTTTGSTGDNGDAYFSYRQGGEIPLTGPAKDCYAPDFNTAKSPLTVPITGPNTLDTLSPRIAATLKESQHIEKSGVVLGEDDANNIYVAPNKEVEVWATFMNEGAGYENSVGFFTWSGKNGSAHNNKPFRNSDGYPTLGDSSDLLKTERIFLPRTSTAFPLPQATNTGTTVYLGKFNGGPQGLGVGFMIASNSWSGGNVRIAPTTANKGGGVNPNRDKTWIFYSVKGMNPECSLLTPCNDRDKHTVLLMDDLVTGSTGNKYHRMVLGLEDIRRTEGDHDFNDVLLTIHVKELSADAFQNKDAISDLGGSVTTDTDKDGVPDSLDEFPNDKDRAFSRYYPGKTTWGTLAYEDLWPELGDFDFNDMLIRYRTREILNAKREVMDLEMDLRLDAAGAGFRNGFAINLPGKKDQILEAVLTGTKQISPAQPRVSLTSADLVSSTPFLSTVTGGQTGAVFQIFQDSKLLITPDNGTTGSTPVSTPNCNEPERGFRNTGRNCATAPWAEFKLTVKFKAAQKIFPLPPYDPFLFRSKNKADAYTDLGNNLEVHLPGKFPTSRADQSLFGKVNDRTNLSTGNTYLSDKDQPWALDIPIEWDYPYEKLDLRTPYPNFIPWATSKGTTHKNWYSIPPVGNATFRANAASSD